LNKIQIVETSNSAKELYSKLENKEVFVQLIYDDINRHSLFNPISAVYLNDFENEYLINISNCDAKKVDVTGLNLNFKKTYLFGAKEALHQIKLQNYIDLHYYLHSVSNKHYKVNELFDFETHKWYEMNYFNIEDLNKYIPILKHLEYCRFAFQYAEYILDNFTFDEYNNEMINNLNFIEAGGLYTEDGYEYTQYNLLTSTGRPSNSFGGINYAALNKKDGSRERFVSRFKNEGMLIEYDFDSYHLRLVGNKIEYDLPKESVHEYFAKQYNTNYEDSKKLSFKYLYGGITKEIAQQIPYFEGVNQYVNTLWNTYNKEKQVVSDIYNRRFIKSNLFDMNPNKLFNYMIQLMETERNMSLITTLKESLQNKKSKLILYNYDAFLFDYCKEDGENILNDIKKILEVDGYPTKITAGKNYHTMERYEI